MSPFHLWWGLGGSPGRDTYALARWPPENVVANPPVSCPSRPPLGLKGHVQNFLSVTWGIFASHISLINSSTLFDCCDFDEEKS